MIAKKAVYGKLTPEKIMMYNTHENLDLRGYTDGKHNNRFINDKNICMS